MVSIYKSILFGCFFLAASLCAMDVDTDVYYVRFGENWDDKEGLLTTFPKSVLNDMQILKDAQADLGADVGTVENPFFLDLHALSPDDFDKVISLIEQVRNFIATNPQQNNAGAIQEFLWGNGKQGLFNRGGGLLNTLDRYTRLTTLLSCGNYLGLGPIIMEALKLCITIPPREKSMALPEDIGVVTMWGSETIDRALKAGLKNINRLPNDLLIPIKEAVLHNVTLNIEKKIIADMNDPKTKHQKTVLEVPEQWKQAFSYAKIVNPYQVDIRFGNQVGALWWFDSSSFKGASELQLPVFPMLGAMPNQHLISSRLKEQNIDPNIINILNLPSFAYNDDNFWSFYNMTYNGVEIGIGYIWNAAKKAWISIPNQVSWLAPFKGNNGQEKFVCIVGTKDDDPKIVIVDPITGECQLIRQLYKHGVDSDYKVRPAIAGATVLGSKLIYHTIIREKSDVFEGKTINGYLDIVDLNSYNRIAHIKIINGDSGEDVSEHMASATSDGPMCKILAFEHHNVINVYLLARILFNGSQSIRTFAFVINAKNFELEAKYEVDLGNRLIGAYIIPRIPSKQIVTFDYMHPDLVNLIGKDIFVFNGDIYVGGFDVNGTKNFFIYKYLPKETLAIFDKIKGLTDLSIEQLYMLEEIIYRLTNNSFAGMTPTEKQLFESMDLKTQNIFLNLFSKGKPITEMTGRQFIVNPKKAGEYQEPLKKYIATPRRQKRRAQEAPEEERPAKKPHVRRSGVGDLSDVALAKSEGGKKKMGDEESESEDETTLDESEEDKE